VCVCVCVRSQSIIIWELFISFLLGNVHFYNFFIMVMLFIFFLLSIYVNECVMIFSVSQLSILLLWCWTCTCVSVCLAVVYSQCSVVILYQNNDLVSVSKNVCARVSKL
jgi:hypothetical protein